MKNLNFFCVFNSEIKKETRESLGQTHKRERESFEEKTVLKKKKRISCIYKRDFFFYFFFEFRFSRYVVVVLRPFFFLKEREREREDNVEIK